MLISESTEKGGKFTMKKNWWKKAWYISDLPEKF